MESVRSEPWYIKMTNWEYWPSWAFYWPLGLFMPLFALISRHPFFFSAANPGIKTGGMGLESKFQTVKKIPAALRPKTVFVSPGTPFFRVEEALQRAGIKFPLIAKPDVGYRGLLVTKIATAVELQAYLARYPVDFLIQEFLDYPEEIGVLYYRFPGESTGKITSLTLKEFLFVCGDGTSTIRQLAGAKPRASLQLARLEEHFRERLDEVPAAGERVPLGAIGNHSKGTMFINGNDLISEPLRRTFDRIAGQIDGFFYGRFDTKCRSLEDLSRGRHFKIIEVNGVCSEPTHIYDQQHISYPGALRDILVHWWIICRISMKNNSRGVAFIPVLDMLRELNHLFSDYLPRLKR